MGDVRCQLVWTVVEPRHVHTLESRSHCEFCLCDNRWHSVHAVMADGQLSLRVDASTVTDQLVSASLDLRQELFIGGFSGLCASWRGRVVNTLWPINVVALRRSRPVLGWASR